MEAMDHRLGIDPNALTVVADIQRHQVAQSVLEVELDAVVLMDVAGSVVEWNLAAMELFGWTREEAIGLQLTELIIPQELRNAHQTRMAHYLATEGEGPAPHHSIQRAKHGRPGRHKRGAEEATHGSKVQTNTSGDATRYAGVSSQ